MQDRESMGTKDITKLLIEFSLPATVGMLINAFYNIIDRIFIGNSPDLGTYGLAGVTISFPVITIIMAVALMCGVGGATIFAISLGERNYDRVGKILGNAFSLAIITTGICSILFLIFLEPLLTMFGASAEVLPYAKDYLGVTLLGCVFLGINLTGNNLIRADGHPNIAMLSILLGVIVNIILDWFFIYELKLGMKGAGLATIFGFLTSTIWILYYFTKGKGNTKLLLKNMIIDRAISLKIMAIGLPSFFIQFANSAWNTVLNSTLTNYGGDMAISAMGIVNSFQTLLLMPVIGINQGALPIIGYNYGANKINRVKETVKKSMIIATVICLIGFSAIQLFSEEIIYAFNQDSELVNLGSKMLKTWFLVLPIIGIPMVSANYFQAIGKVKPAIFLSLTRQIIILLPFILILSRLFGLDGIIYAAPISDLVATLLASFLLIRSMKKLKHTDIDFKNPL